MIHVFTPGLKLSETERVVEVSRVASSNQWCCQLSRPVS